MTPLSVHPYQQIDLQGGCENDDQHTQGEEKPVLTHQCGTADADTAHHGEERPEYVHPTHTVLLTVCDGPHLGLPWSLSGVV